MHVKTYLGAYYLKSYSQEGEDMILRRFFEKKKDGFYVDVGAFHPKRYSNTYFFYKRGWRGINVDAMPGGMYLFNTLRSEDINIEKPISDKKETLRYYGFNEQTYNTFSKELADERRVLPNVKLNFTKEIETVSLEEILEEHLVEKQEIDFISIDVEGWDFMVLKSMNLVKYQPKVILIELLNFALDESFDNEICLYLKDHGYRIAAKSFNTVFFMRNDFCVQQYKK
jgi:FkbM family methyltransferase